MLTVTDLRKSFASPTGKRIKVLRGVTFSSAVGETVAIVGASGSGKSTLLHLLGGLDSPDAGTIRLGEFAIDGKPSIRLARVRNSQIGFVFQFHHLLPELSATENVALPLMISGASQRESLDRAAVALENLGLGTRTSHLIRFLSGGEQQRVALCRALITEPELVLADEPTGNLDAAIEMEISSQLVDYARNQGKILIVATHNERLASMCDRTMLLEHGELKEAG